MTRSYSGLPWRPSRAGLSVQSWAAGPYSVDDARQPAQDARGIVDRLSYPSAILSHIRVASPSLKRPWPSLPGAFALPPIVATVPGRSDPHKLLGAVVALALWEGE